MPHIRLNKPSDSIEAINLLLRRAYTHLEKMGLNYTVMDQSGVTANRIRGTCYVATDGSNFVGTILVQPTHDKSACFYLTQPGIACANQFAGALEFRNNGLGSEFLLCTETWARENGFPHLAIDTAELATSDRIL